MFSHFLRGELFQGIPTWLVLAPFFIARARARSIFGRMRSIFAARDRFLTSAFRIFAARFRFLTTHGRCFTAHARFLTANARFLAAHVRFWIARIRFWTTCARSLAARIRFVIARVWVWTTQTVFGSSRSIFGGNHRVFCRAHSVSSISDRPRDFRESILGVKSIFFASIIASNSRPWDKTNLRLIRPPNFSQNAPKNEHRRRIRL